MSEWIHCNKCYTRYRSNLKFFITTCGHIICEQCSKTDGNYCTVCKSHSELVPLNNNLKPEMQPFFRPQSEAIERARQICLFQDINKTALLKNITGKYLATKNELTKSFKALHECKKENAKLRMLIKVGNCHANLKFIN